MKAKTLILCTSTIWMASCNQTEKPITSEENEQIKTEVIASVEKHLDDIISQDYQKVMKFYEKENYVIFGDGAYWGDYTTIDDIWRTWLPRWKAITKWDLKNHKVHVFSRDGAVDFVEWEHERIEEDGDTTKAYGFLVWGMQRYPDGWRSINVAVDHRYTAGPNMENKN